MRSRVVSFSSGDNRNNLISRMSINTSIDSYISLRQTMGEQNCSRFLRDCFKERADRWSTATTVKNAIITFHQIDNTSEDRPKFTIIKSNRTYYINGERVSMKNLVGLFMNLVTRWKTFSNSDDVDEAILNYLETPPEINHAIINKINYRFIKEDGVGENTLLNVQLTGKDTVAIELYTDMWVDFTFKEIVMFIRACKTGSNKYGAISYQELYHMQIGELLTTSEEKLVEAFLIQNRASNLVTRRSMELIDKLSKQFKNIKKLQIFHRRPEFRDEIQYKGLYVIGRGRWSVTHSYEDDQHVLGRQNVSTRFMHHIVPPLYMEDDVIENMLEENHLLVENPEDKNQYFNITVGMEVLTDGKNLYYQGSGICIDQTDNEVSLGDQIASRAMLLLFDYKNIKSVSTLRGMEPNLGFSNFEEKLEDDEDEMLNLRYTVFTRKHLENLISQAVR